MDTERKISARTWAVVWFVGLTGQLLWTVENAIFNTFAYRTAAGNAPEIIQWMVALSAVATTVSTLAFGAWSDRAGRRKPFIAFGFVLWGIFTIAFGAAGFLPGAVVGLALVLADTVMSFCGSIGYDAGFGAWTTDISDETNRGTVCGALAVMPVIATIVGTATFGILIDGIGRSGFHGIGYFPFFVIIGCAVIAIGAISLFIVKDDPSLAPNGTGNWVRQFASAFSGGDGESRVMIFLVLATLAAYFISFYVYFPFILPYLEHSLGLGLGVAGLVLGGGLALASFSAIPAGKAVDGGHHAIVLAVAVCVTFAGLLVFSFADRGTMITLMGGMFLAGCGYILALQALNAWLKNLYPASSRGQFEGIRLVFFVCIPMALGPAIGTPIVSNLGMTAVISDTMQRVPSAILFRVSAFLSLVTLVPLFLAARAARKRGLMGRGRA